MIAHTLVDVVPVRILDALGQADCMEPIAVLARRRIGSHQAAVLSGRAAWSLADLQGRAQRYAGHYRTARDRAWQDLCDALPEVVRPRICRGRHGKLSIKWPVAVAVGLEGMVQHEG